MKSIYFFKKFNPKISSCDQIADIGIQALGQEIGSNLTLLQELKLMFASYVIEKYFDQGPIKKMIYFRLEIKVVSCEGMTDKGIRTIANETLQHLQKLQGLTLCFRR